MTIKNLDTQEIKDLLAEHKQYAGMEVYWDTLVDFFDGNTDLMLELYGFNTYEDFYFKVYEPKVIEHFNKTTLKRSNKASKKIKELEDKGYAFTQKKQEEAKAFHLKCQEEGKAFLAKPEFDVLKEHTALIQKDIEVFMEEPLKDLATDDFHDAKAGVLEA